MAEYQKLLDAFDEQHDSSETRDVLRDARLILSNLSVQRGELSQAEEWLEQVLDEYPDDVGAHNDLGYLWADAGKHLHRALRMLEYAVQSDPGNKAYRDSLGWAYYRLERYPEAKAELEKAASADEPDGVILEHLADIQAKLGEAAAKATYERAAEAYRKDEEPAKADAAMKKAAELQASP